MKFDYKYYLNSCPGLSLDTDMNLLETTGARNQPPPPPRRKILGPHPLSVEQNC